MIYVLYVVLFLVCAIGFLDVYMRLESRAETAELAACNMQGHIDALYAQLKTLRGQVLVNQLRTDIHGTWDETTPSVTDQLVASEIPTRPRTKRKTTTAAKRRQPASSRRYKE